ncbi:MAG: GreA/GreB family elongation factor [Myxococcales bacterium]|nr:GreA/GreB family elongation factor [Myxococcales bacterium]
MDRNYMTPAGHKKLFDESERLLKVERPKVVREVADAAAQGDRSENAEYIYGKKRLREIDSRLRFLDSRLKNAQVIDPATLTGDKIAFGATIVLEDEDGHTKSWTLVGEDESEPAEGRMSYKSPLSRAMWAKREGDSFTFKRPDGREVDFTIVSVRFGA